MSGREEWSFDHRTRLARSISQNCISTIESSPNSMQRSVLESIREAVDVVDVKYF